MDIPVPETNRWVTFGLKLDTLKKWWYGLFLRWYLRLNKKKAILDTPKKTKMEPENTSLERESIFQTSI